MINDKKMYNIYRFMQKKYYCIRVIRLNKLCVVVKLQVYSKNENK